MAERRVIAEADVWCRCSVPSRERHGNRLVFYAADYYGRGEHVYVSGSPLFDHGHGVRVLPGGFSDGHPERVARWWRRAGFTGPVAA